MTDGYTIDNATSTFSPKSPDYTESNEPHLWRGEHSQWVEVLINVIIWFMCVTTIIGNALVIAAFIYERNIRAKVSNLYILNLSLSDFIIGCVALTLSNLYRKTGLWQYGEIVCKFWLVVDWASCFVSVWAIVLISYDRYVLVTKGLEYDRCQTRRKFYVLSGMIWIGCFVRYGVSFIGYDIWNETTVDYSKACDSPTLYIFPLILFDFATSICLPVLLIAIFNIIVYVNIYRRSRGLLRVAASSMASTNGGGEVTLELSTNDKLPSACHDGGKFTKREGTNDIRKLRRSAITLGLIVGVGAFCWTPYYAYIFSTIFQVKVEITLVMTSYYIWWGNSACNPLLFVATNPGIRNGVAKILHIRK